MGGFLCWTAHHATRPSVRYERAPGLRTPATLRSRRAWLAAHEKIAPLLWAAGVGTIVYAGAAALWLTTQERGTADGFAAVWALLLLPVMVSVVRRGQREARRVD
ncbi:SdpI family protein [Kineococcus sp. SYSU DK018]|uniref:SdpI family protein n=1 Tax=Kineococcus sp. SYSU DK018 TaxID=3383139 RepID=UPI003D7D78CD